MSYFPSQLVENSGEKKAEKADFLSEILITVAFSVFQFHEKGKQKTIRSSSTLYTLARYKVRDDNMMRFTSSQGSVYVESGNPPFGKLDLFPLWPVPSVVLIFMKETPTQFRNLFSPPTTHIRSSERNW